MGSKIHLMFCAFAFTLLAVPPSALLDSAFAATAGSSIHIQDDAVRWFIKDQFLLNYTNFNHGSFGACPKQVMSFQDSLRLRQEKRPDIWMRSEYRQRLNETRRDLAEYLGLEVVKSADNLVLVESASTAVNAVLRSLQWRSGDIIMYFSLAYAMVKNTAQWLHQQHGVEIVEIPISFPLDRNQSARSIFLDPLHRSLEELKAQGKEGRLKMFVVDQISSAPALLEPVQEASILVKSYNPNTFVLVDGAHGMGQLRQQIPDLAPIDAYLSNGHKWLYSPKGSAVLWFNESFISDVFPEPTVVSSANAIGSTSLAERFNYVSVRDYSGWISMSEALRFRSQIGGDAFIHQYCRELALVAKAHLLRLWEVDALAPDEMEAFMINIRLPAIISNSSIANDLITYLLEKHNMYVRVLQQPTSRIFYTRLSAQVYLEFADFEKLGRAVQAFVSMKKLHEDHLQVGVHVPTG